MNKIGINPYQFFEEYKSKVELKKFIKEAKDIFRSEFDIHLSKMANGKEFTDKQKNAINITASQVGAILYIFNAVASAIEANNKKILADLKEYLKT